MSRKETGEPKPKDAEPEPDAWERFERAVGKVVPPKRPPPKTDEEQEK